MPSSETVPAFSCRSTNIGGFLKYYFEARNSFGARSAVLGNFTLGQKSDDLQTETALVMAIIKRTLGFGDRIDTIFALYGEDPKDVLKLASHLSAECRVSMGQALRVIEAWSTSDKRIPITGKPEQKLAGWHNVSVEILEEVFRERGGLA